MKKAIKNVKKGLLITAMLLASLSFATEGTPFFKLVKNVKKTSLTLDNVKEGNTLYIKDNYGVELYQEIIHTNGLYARGFDLTSLPNGAYRFELDADAQIKVIPFTVEENAITVNNNKAKTIFKPTIRIKGNLVFISKLALHNEPLKIEVYYEKLSGSDLMLSETIKDTKNIERVYKLTGLENGDYKIVFHTNEREFTEFINN